jgi:thiol:disulfide interchange protein
MQKIVSAIIFFCLFLVLGYAEVKSKSPNLETTVEKTETKADNLGAFEKLNWETDMDHAFELAKIEHKNVMVMIECITCKWCIKMKKEALSDPKVHEKLQSYILLKVQRSDKSSTKHLPDFSGAIPSFYFMQPDRETLETVIGYFVAEDFLEYLTDIEDEN